MKLLMLTRTIDADDWLAGHAYEWAKKLSSKLLAAGGSLVVICLSKGNLGDLNAEVYSLGKETGAGRLARLFAFIKLASKLVPKADGVFCHQNPEYTIAVWPWAKVYGKKIVSWYTHKSVTWKTRLMLKLSDKVLTASKESFRINSAKVKIVGHGIDTARFVPSESRRKTEGQKNEIFKIITVGRISPVKNLEVLIEAARILAFEKQIWNFVVEIYGAAGLDSHKIYYEQLKKQVLEKDLDQYVHFKPPVPHSRIVSVYQNASVFVNLSATGSLDKAVLEAMSCEVPVVTSNEAFLEMLQPFEDNCLAKPNNPADLALKLKMLKELNLSDQRALSANLRRIVLEGHSLDKLGSTILKAFK